MIILIWGASLVNNNLTKPLIISLWISTFVGIVKMSQKIIEVSKFEDF